MIYRSNNNYILEDVMGDTAIIAIEQDIAKMKSMVATNETGRKMLECLADGKEHSTEDVVSSIMEEFEVEEAMATKDVDEFLGKLSQCGYVTIVG
ncbi:MAG: PqqD family protein [Bacteroidia bacterium]|nr:PqqD family protein [Bacteroidia bacterium]